MPKRPRPQPEVEPSKLRRPLADVEAMLDKQITRGEEIAARLRPGELPPEACRWHDENAAMLERIFTGTEDTEYKNCISFGPAIVAVDDDDDEKPWHLARLEWLHSLRARLYLYETVALDETIARAPATVVADSHDAGGASHRGMAQPVIFISHISDEAPVAHVLKDWIKATFPGQCAVFVSSDVRDLPAGTRWLEAIEKALGATRVLLVVSSPTSLTRPWIHIETGCALMKRVPVVPICHSGQRRGQLPSPHSTFQAVEVDSPSFVTDLLTSLAKHLGIAGVPRIDENRMRADVERACRECARPDGGNRADAATPAAPDPLDDGELHMLRMIVTNDDPGYTAGDLAKLTSLTTTKAQYYIDQLMERKFLVRHLIMGGPAQYTLSRAGRKYLADAGLL